MESRLDIYHENVTCKEIALFLAKNNIDCKIYSSIEIKNKELYNGCTLFFNNKSPSEIKTLVWNKLKKNYDLSYGFFNCPYVYIGNIENINK